MSAMRAPLLYGLLILCATPRVSAALTFEEVHQASILFLYGGIGFFGALAILYFFGGFIVYLVRLGQEYRQEGIYNMLHGVRILFYVLCAVLILKLLE
ncbi:MAG: hypothetical protein AAB649_04195 [Patescibacteria group bacterium]